MLADLEPFVELPGQCLGYGGDVFRFGYRCRRTGAPFAIVEIPASTVAKFVPLQTSVRVTIDGRVVTEAELPYDRSALDRSSQGVSLIKLIEETLHPDNLRLEDAGPRELNSLHQELEICMQRVKAALASLNVHGLATSPSKLE
ncbi:hypothetical protein JQ616_35345 [Bradyrhizobium tropiciagri]|uniref:hypothetical protein n=1 Tax=Bradyrhizobium tropiciagri TaxID=312253 RepID=UPI001BA56495|nr:hypothetical protein [Bradyrhizobium tropiciagri]MBR0900255.1 hypothetical protein [Bradyrhizobium tropiciagri]